MSANQEASNTVTRPRCSPEARASGHPSCSIPPATSTAGSSSINPPSPTTTPACPKTRPSTTVVEYYGSSVGFCGYCKASSSSCISRVRTVAGGRHTFDMKTFALKPDDYQELLDRGWRRSGDYCYHPINSRCCCPNYAISCKTTKFKLSRSQRLCIENLNSFLVNGFSAKKLSLDYSKSNSTNKPQNHQIPSHHLDTVHWRSFEQLKQSNKMRHQRFVKSCESKVEKRGLSLGELMAISKERALRKIYKHASLEDYLYPTSETTTDGPHLTPKHRLQLKLFHVESEMCSEFRREEELLIQKYQEKIHHENPKDWSGDRFNDFLVDSPLLVEPLRNRSYMNESLNQIDDTLTKRVYSKNYILVEPPNLPTSYGTYHCIYLLDKKLIAVGVLDILPKCVTTVYFFYDPLFEFLKLGTYSALVEISMTRQITEFYTQPSSPDPLIHYYLGYYVHECKKMHYKTQFYPSYLLCSETFQYFPTKLCLEKLKEAKYARFNPDPNNHYNIYNEPPEVTANNSYLIPVMTPVTNTFKIAEYRSWILEHFGQPFVDILFDRFLYEYARMIGMPLLARMKLKIHSIHRALEMRSMKLESDNKDCACDGDH